MKYIYTKFILVFLIFSISFSCKTKTDTDINKKTKSSNIVKHKKTKLNCLVESDSLEIKEFVKDLIFEIKHNNVEKLSSKFIYPVSMFDFSFENKKKFITQWNKNDRLKNYLSLDIYDENDEFIGKSNFSNTQIIFYQSNRKGCYKIQFGLGSGLLFEVGRIEDKLKIVKFDTAG